MTLRITPARAGKTVPALITDHDAEDHPRSCGKDGFLLCLQDLLIGSPPLVRERPCVANFVQSHPGITPARAGKTYQTAHAGAGR